MGKQKKFKNRKKIAQKVFLEIRKQIFENDTSFLWDLNLYDPKNGVFLGWNNRNSPNRREESDNRGLAVKRKYVLQGGQKNRTFAIFRATFCQQKFF